MATPRFVLGFVLVGLLAATYLYILVSSPGSDLSFRDQVVIGAGILSGFVLWVWMFTDFFARKDLRHGALWGWALFLFNLLAAAVYFVAIYFPRERKSRDASPTLHE
jgi:hypothetical protein